MSLRDALRRALGRAPQPTVGPQDLRAVVERIEAMDLGHIELINELRNELWREIARLRSENEASREQLDLMSAARADAVRVHAEIHNRRDEIQKTFDAKRVEQVHGYWTAMDLSMADVTQRTRTELIVEQVAYDVGLKPDDFSRRELERAGP